MKNDSLYIHVGLMKTATTMLQKRVFPEHGDITYLGGPQYINDHLRKTIAAITKQDRLLFNSNKYKPGVDEILSNAKAHGKSVLISSEDISTPTIDRLTKAERLQAVFGDFKIIVCLRNPIDFLSSFFSEAVKQVNPSIQRLPSIEDWLAHEWSDQRATRVTRFLDHSRLLSAYDHLIGRNNVCVLLYEELRDNPTEFSQQLSQFLEVDSNTTLKLLKGKSDNKRINELDYLLYKHGNLSKLNSRLKISKLIPSSIKSAIVNKYSQPMSFNIPPDWRNTIYTYYDSANAELDLYVNRNKLTKYQYIANQAAKI